MMNYQVGKLDSIIKFLAEFYLLVFCVFQSLIEICLLVFVLLNSQLNTA
jgi:hypothetical protein